ncbi:hypothetical protein OIDMADRAFT_134243 [Oidiodendron maius Zn]|uniref:Uncharacterized protein n=1 Tax=Oidiodendron maius (strain Zn) TaxID=913774 RepID=A0A0C3D0F4_OIDMZ|nr:hypothetical protein OIDMADRAFT_134243 [Oidiodendron maius Zn]
MPPDAHPAVLPQSDANYNQNHSHTCTTSPNTSPAIVYPEYKQRHQHQHQNQHFQQHPQYSSNNQVYRRAQRRTPSQGTFSTASSGNAAPLHSPSQDPRCSTSSRSGGSPRATSYVALMRRQKATVWCDRAQREDPRLVAAQTAATMRTATAVVRRSSSDKWHSAFGACGTLASCKSITSKIRHHGKAGLVSYSPDDLYGSFGGVPMRLSATEVEGEDSDDENTSVHRGYHSRSDSGRSSIGSSWREPTYSRQSGASSIGKWSSVSTPSDSLHDLAEDPGPGDPNYVPADIHDGRGSAESTGQARDLTSYYATRLTSNNLLQSTVTHEKSVRNPQELRRRGSADESTMTMSTGRLYIANPDLDSD